MALDKADGKFLSVIRCGRLKCETGSVEYVEYEIVCQIRLRSCALVEQDVVHKWSVWKRFSEFVALHEAIRKSIGWLMRSIHLPSHRTLVYDKTTAEFIEKRRNELNNYWQKVISIDQVAEFSRHHCSQDIKSFVNYDSSIGSQSVAASGAPVVSWIPRLPGVRHGQRSLSTLRRSSGRDIPSQTASSLQYRSESAAPTSQTELIPSGQYQSDNKDVPVGHLVISQKVDNSTNFSQTQVPPHTSGARHQLLNSILLLRKHDG